MKAFGDYEAVNLKTGEKLQRVVGDGESRLISSRCPGGCGTDFAEFPEMRHAPDECPGPECTCYEVIGGHQPGCPYGRHLQRKRQMSEPSKTALEIAARVWCDQAMSNVVMDVKAAEEIAVIVDRVIKSQKEQPHEG